jgi:uridine kinase
MGVRIIGISGGSGSGKTTIVQRISQIIPDFTFLAQDSYYKSAEYVDNENITAFNFDHPAAFDTDLMVEQLRALKGGETIQVPVYDFVHHRRKVETMTVAPRNLVIFEGIMVFVEPTKAYADLIIPEGGNNEKALQVLTSFMQGIP